jgi:pilus assembly protein CpaF
VTGRLNLAADLDVDHSALALVRDRLAGLGRDYTPGDVAIAMRAEGLAVSDSAVLAAVESLRRHSVGAGILEPLLREPGVTDVLVNGADQVFVDRGSGLELTDLRFPCEGDVRRLAQRLAASVGRRLDDAMPFVDARLPDGSRVHAVLGCLASPGTCISLRVPARRTFSLQDCVASGSLTPAAAQLLSRMIEAKLAFLISGGTGSGKTTLLAALLAFVPHQERIVIVEDSRELAPNHPHVVRIEGRPANAELAGAISLTDLVRQSLRMRPDRLVG